MTQALGRYAVYLVDNAAEALGPVAQPFIQQDESGNHFIATEVDTGGAFCELTLQAQTESGTTVTVEIMIPMGMIRLIISMAHEGRMGFHARNPA